MILEGHKPTGLIVPVTEWYIVQRKREMFKLLETNYPLGMVTWTSLMGCLFLWLRVCQLEEGGHVLAWQEIPSKR